MASEQKYPVNWEKVGIYITISFFIFTTVIYIADMKERIAKLEVKVEKLEDKK